MRKSLAMSVVFAIGVPLYAADPAPLQEAPDTEIGYQSPQAALDALRSKSGVSIREENQWYVASDPSQNTIWSIAQPGNPAYPSAFKRTIVDSGGALHLRMRVLCGASKETCDATVRSFLALNEKIKGELKKKAQQP